MIRVGRFVLHHPNQGKIWISDAESGEGGAFDVHELALLLEEFYKENF